MSKRKIFRANRDWSRGLDCVGYGAGLHSPPSQAQMLSDQLRFFPYETKSLSENPRWAPPGKLAIVGLRVGLRETGLQRCVKQSGGEWNSTKRVWETAGFLRTMARDHQLDLTRVISIGHSAGGLLAMWLAARPKIPTNSDLYMKDPLRLTGVVNLDGPADLKATLPLQQPIMLSKSFLSSTNSVVIPWISVLSLPNIPNHLCGPTRMAHGLFLE